MSMPDEPQRTVSFAHVTTEERMVADYIRDRRRASPIPLKEIVARASPGESRPNVSADV